MIIDFDSETKKIISVLKKANGYMDCEMMISSNIHQHLISGVTDSNIEIHLIRLRKHFDELIVINKDPYDSVRYRYVTHLMGTDRLKQLINKSK
jgi:hypothetical protein